MNIVAIAMLVFTIVMLLIVAVAMLVGFFKGWKKCLLGLCRTVVAAILAFFTVFIICRVIPAGGLYEIVESAFGEIEYLSESEALQALGGTFVYTLVMPFVFALIFIILDLILLIPAFFIGKALGIYSKKEKKKKAKKAEKLDDSNDGYVYQEDGATAQSEQKHDEPEQQRAAVDEKTGFDRKLLFERLGGAGIRLVTSLVVIAFVLLPLSGIIYTLTDGVVKIAHTANERNITVNIGNDNLELLEYTLTDGEGNLLPSEVDRMASELLSPIRDNLFLRLSYSTPVRAMCNAMTATTDASGQVRNEIAQIVDVACDALYFLVEPDSYGEDQKEAATRIIGYISESQLHSEVVADLITVFAPDIKSALLQDSENGDINIVIDPLFEILENTTVESVQADFNTLRDIIITMIDYDLPATIAAALEQKSEGDIIEAFADEEFLYELFYSLYHNDDYRHMTGPIIDYAFTVIVRQFDPKTERVNVAVVDENYTDESIHDEARIFSNLFKDAKKIMDIAPALLESNDAMSAIGGADVKTLGHFIDIARESKLIGGGVTTVLITVLESETFDSMRDVSDILVKHIREDDDISMENLLGAVQQFVGVMMLYENTDATDTAELTKALRELNQACDDRTAAILKEIIDDSNILNAALLSSGNDKKNESAGKVLNVLLDKLTTGEFTDEQYETEAKAVDYALKLVQASSSNEIKDICANKEDRREMIETINNSQIASAALIEMAYEDGDPTKPLTDDALSLKENLDAEDIDNVRTECKEYYQEQIKSGESTEQLETNIKAISAIFDGKISDEDLAAWAAEAKAN